MLVSFVMSCSWLALAIYTGWPIENVASLFMAPGRFRKKRSNTPTVISKGTSCWLTAVYRVCHKHIVIDINWFLNTNLLISWHFLILSKVCSKFDVHVLYPSSTVSVWFAFAVQMEFTQLRVVSKQGNLRKNQKKIVDLCTKAIDTFSDFAYKNKTFLFIQELFR